MDQDMKRMEQGDTTMDAVIIGNPNSGRAGDRDLLTDLAGVLGRDGMKVEVLNTERPNHATDLATMAGDRLVVAAGGDGTVNEVLNGLTPGAALGVIPLGTANVLARELGMPLDPEEACARIRDGRATQIDLGIATDGHGTERRFACMAGLGFDAQVVNEVPSRMKRYLKVVAFPLTALKVYAQRSQKDGMQPRIQVVNGDTIYVVEFAIVANGRKYGGDFEVSDDASLTTGEFAVVLVEKIGELLRADILTRILTRQPLDRSMRSFTTLELKARAPGDTVPVQIDGEVWGQLPMSFRIVPKGLRIVR
jgi:YegS/Rv2252/BmrU family lipid kinase